MTRIESAEKITTAMRILEKEKGYMTVDSEYGKGSCFSVFLQNCKN